AEGVGRAFGAVGAVRVAGDVAVVGAGVAGLGCARELERAGVTVSLYESAERVGGRVWSLSDRFPGQTVERGGELIDTGHATMRGWAREFGLPLESLAKLPGEVFYYFDGVRHPESAVVDEYRALVARMRDDLRAVGEPTADDFTPADAALDRVSLAEYLETRGAGRLIRQVIDQTYTIEYGIPIGEQSCLAFLNFIHADRRSRFQPYGIFSDERFHVVGGNDGIVRGLHASLARPAALGQRLVRVARTAAGRVELTFRAGSRTVVRAHDAAVITVPFSVLRGVELHASLALPAWKLRAIREFRYGTNAKLMVGFTSRPWAAQGNNGAAYSDLANFQSGWETNPSRASATAGVITDYTGGALGARLDPARTQAEAELFLADYDRVVPGARAAARRDARGAVVAHLEAWPRNPDALGSYSANALGYFTTIADNEAKPVGNLYFAGEHTSSFYEWQGFMEGGALSGLRAAGEVIDALRGR
ncbi:MAG: amine oxidase, partial [Myxococcaceae bacterium]|nr:amine oxidase [Myxococcaceae bacterium]